MNNTGNYTVGFRNQNQVVLFEKELTGQISDGYWENSRPYDHYKLPCWARPFVARTESEIGRNFNARMYNFSAPELLEAVGNRMINLVKLSRAFPHIPLEDIFDIDSTPRAELEAWVKYSVNDKHGYWLAKLNKVCSLLEASSVEEAIVKLEVGFNSVTYTMKDLRKDLNEMKACWRMTQKSA